MLSRENSVIAVCILGAVGSVYALSTMMTLPTWGSVAVVLGIGVLLPTLLNEYLDGR